MLAFPSNPLEYQMLIGFFFGLFVGMPLGLVCAALMVLNGARSTFSDEEH